MSSFDTPVLHLRGPVLVAPDEPVEQAWVVDGHVTYLRPEGSVADEAAGIEGWVLPGLVDAHCHVGTGRARRPSICPPRRGRRSPTGRRGTAAARRGLARRHPLDRHRDDLPRLVRAGRHLARPRRYIRNFAHEIEPEQLADARRIEAARGDGWVKLVGDWIDREIGDLAPCWPLPALAEAIARGPRAAAPG